MSQQVVHTITIGLYVAEVCRRYSRKDSMKNCSVFEKFEVNDILKDKQINMLDG
jgi:hypothetical protein